MNFYKEITAYVMIFSVFHCNGMDLKLQRIEEKNAFFQKIERTFFSQKHFDNDGPIEPSSMMSKDLAVCIKLPVDKPIFEIDKNQARQIKLLLEMRQSEAGEKIIQKVNEHFALRKKQLLLEKTTQNNPLQKQSPEKKQEIIHKKVVAEKRKEAAKKKNPKNSAIQPQFIEKPSNNRKEIWNALKSLMHYYGVRDLSSLAESLRDIALDIYKEHEHNDKENGPYFDKNHILTGKINRNWSFIFCPCTNKVTAVNQPYIFVNRTLNDLPKDYLCGGYEDCKNYSDLLENSADEKSDSDSDTVEDQDTVVILEEY